MRIDVRSTALFEKRASEAVLGGPRRSFRLLGGLGMDVFEPVRIGIRSTALFGKELSNGYRCAQMLEARSPEVPNCPYLPVFGAPFPELLQA